MLFRSEAQTKKKNNNHFIRPDSVPVCRVAMVCRGIPLHTLVCQNRNTLSRTNTMADVRMNGIHAGRILNSTSEFIVFCVGQNHMKYLKINSAHFQQRPEPIPVEFTLHLLAANMENIQNSEHWALWPLAAMYTGIDSLHEHFLLFHPLAKAKAEHFY